MKKTLRAFVFSYIALYVTQLVIGGLYFGPNRFITTLLVLTGVSILNLFMPSIFGIISLPRKGVMFVFMNFLMLLITIYVLTLFVPSFYIINTTVAKLVIFGIVLPAKDLTVFWSAVFTALLLSVLYNFFTWLSANK